MKRSELKKLVKECLLEILIEGFGSSADGLNESRQENPVMQNQKHQVRRPALDLIRASGPEQSKKISPMHMGLGKRDIPQNSSEIYKNVLGVDETMASIFADTAATTLREQASSDSSISRKSNPVIDTGVDPSMFEGSANWETLAFSEPKNHR